MTEARIKKTYNLSERTARFAVDCRIIVRNIDRTVGNIEDGKQLVRSSGSVAANYLEADEAISRKDFTLRIKICRKEARESRLWLQLIFVSDSMETEVRRLQNEAYELVKIFNSIVEKSS